MKNRIGIMGGTFNPIHNGHIMLANEAYEQYSLDKVWIMVSPMPPHKKELDIIDAFHRGNMARLASDEYPDRFEFSDYELKRSGYIYTADTLTMLCEEHPESEFYFIIGGDSLKNFEHWYKPDIILKKAVILAAIRDHYDIENVKSQIEYLTLRYDADIRLLKTVNVEVSSTMLRKMVSEGKKIDDFVPYSVAQYIYENKLYLN